MGLQIPEFPSVSAVFCPAFALLHTQLCAHPKRALCVCSATAWGCGGGCPPKRDLLVRLLKGPGQEEEDLLCCSADGNEQRSKTSPSLGSRFSDPHGAGLCSLPHRGSRYCGLFFALFYFFVLKGKVNAPCVAQAELWSVQSATWDVKLCNSCSFISLLTLPCALPQSLCTSATVNVKACLRYFLEMHFAHSGFAEAP